MNDTGLVRQVEEIMFAYHQSKAINGKEHPLTVGYYANAIIDACRTGGATRERLPDERKSVTHRFEILGETVEKKCPHCGKVVETRHTGCTGYLTVGLDEKGKPAEMFLTMAKAGETRRGFANAFSLAVSLCLRYGVPLRKLCEKYIGSRFEPFGLVKANESGIRQASSIPDYVFRWMASRFLESMGEENSPVGVARGSK